MSDLQKHNQELTQPDGTLLVKVPDDVYSFWWDTAYELLTHKTSVETRQKTIFKLVTKWVDTIYPGYGIINFQDYNASEAHELSKRVGKPITWGMYVLLQIGGSMQPISITDKLLNDAGTSG